MVTPAEPPAISHESAREQAWTTYWQSGALHSLPGTFEGNYGGPIGRHWRSFLADLQGPCAVLDLATGNGPLPLTLLEVNPRPDVSCMAVDLASVSPDWWPQMPEQQRSRVRFMGGVDLGSLPFDAAQFDVVVSQFGFEYGPRPSSTKELVRVLRDHGQLQLVCHHRESFLLEQARHERAHLAWIRSPDGWLQAAEAMLEPMSLAGHAQGQAILSRERHYQLVRMRFDEWAQAADQRVQTHPCADVLGEVGQALAQSFQTAMSDGLATGRAHWAQLCRQLDLADQRLQHMQSAALSLDDLASLVNGFEQHGVKVSVSPLEDEHGSWAWILSGKKMGA